MLALAGILQSLSFNPLILWVKKQMKDAKLTKECI